LPHQWVSLSRWLLEVVYAFTLIALTGLSSTIEGQGQEEAEAKEGECKRKRGPYFQFHLLFFNLIVIVREAAADPF
jgi:hypothetical protein